MPYTYVMGDEAHHERENEMTQAEMNLQDDKARAEIAKLTAETAEIIQSMKYRFWVMAAAYVSALAVVLKFV